MIKPTIGRVMWFWWDDIATRDANALPCAALVTFVHSDDCVNLAVFDRNSDARPMQAVQLWNGDGPRPRSFHCEWMPYQKGQAAKVEAGIDSNTLNSRLAAVEKAQIDLARGYEYLKSLIPQPNKAMGVPPPPTK